MTFPTAGSDNGGLLASRLSRGFLILLSNVRLLKAITVFLDLQLPHEDVESPVILHQPPGFAPAQILYSHSCLGIGFLQSGLPRRFPLC